MANFRRTVMPLSPNVIQILACPATKQRVQLAPQELVDAMNEKIRSGLVQTVVGELVVEPVDALLIREDGLVAYAVRQDIPVMLVEEGIPVAD